MFRVAVTALAALALVALNPQISEGRGGAGGGRGAGGGGRGFSGGNRGFDGGNRGFSGGNRGLDGGSRGFQGGNRGFDGGARGFDGGARTGGISNAGREGIGREGFGRDGARGLDGARGNFGFGQHADARNFAAAGHETRAVNRDTMASRADNVRNNFDHHDWYNHNWWNNHPGAWFAAGWGVGTAWNWATWPALGGWYGWGAATPIYYDYGTNVTYDDGQVYYGDQPVASAADYYQQASTIAGADVANKGSEDEWTPLGVFGLVQGDQASASAVFQLATNKSGAIGGNFSDLLTGSTLVVKGSVDQKTQRAAWTVGDNKDTVYDTSIANLTLDQSTLLVHFGSDRTQQWMLVRMKQPEEQKTGEKQQ